MDTGRPITGTDIKWKLKTHCTCVNKIQFLNFKFTTAVVVNKCLKQIKLPILLLHVRIYFYRI